MLCTNCGNELNVNAKFCPKCGTAINHENIKHSDVTANENQNSFNTTTSNPETISEYSQNEITQQQTQKKQKKRKVLIAVVVIIALFVFLIIPYAKDSIIKKEIHKKTTDTMEGIKAGLSDEDYRVIEGQVLILLLENNVIPESLVQTIYAYIDGQDIADIYAGLMSHMQYEVGPVKKIDKNTYQESLIISNVNFLAVMRAVAENKKNDYTGNGILGKIKQGFSDAEAIINGDFSQSLATAMVEAGDDIMLNEPNNVQLSNFSLTVTIVNGNADLNLDDGNFLELIKACCGIPNNAAIN